MTMVVSPPSVLVVTTCSLPDFRLPAALALARSRCTAFITSASWPRKASPSFWVQSTLCSIISSTCGHRGERLDARVPGLALHRVLERGARDLRIGLGPARRHHDLERVGRRHQHLGQQRIGIERDRRDQLLDLFLLERGRGRRGRRRRRWRRRRRLGHDGQRSRDRDRDRDTPRQGIGPERHHAAKAIARSGPRPLPQRESAATSAPPSRRGSARRWRRSGSERKTTSWSANPSRCETPSSAARRRS